MHKRPGSENTARRIPQRRMCPELNMGRDNRVMRKQLTLTKERTSDLIIRKPIATKTTKQVGSSIGLQEVGDWTFWNVRPLPKCKKVQKTAGEPETLGPLQHSETLTD
jgi:hypothetical protein